MPFSLPEKVPQVLIKKEIAMCFKQRFPAEKEKSDLIKIKSDFGCFELNDTNEMCLKTEEFIVVLQI